MLYNEKDSDFVFEVSSGKLYKKCKKEQVPFHRWYAWIEHQLLLIDKLQNPKK